MLYEKNISEAFSCWIAAILSQTFYASIQKFLKDGKVKQIKSLKKCKKNIVKFANKK